MKKAILFLAAMAWVRVGFNTSVQAGTPPAVSEIAGLNPHTIPQSQANELRIAVTPSEYDDVGAILDIMGWMYTEIQYETLTDSDSLTQFDVIFINCHSDSFTYADSAAISLEQFVRQGGTLYASDWAYEYIEKAFPGYINYYPENPLIGDDQIVTADIVDPGLASFLDKPTLEINFELPLWVPVESVEDSVKVYLAADIQLMDGAVSNDNPLTVSFAYGNGRVVYTAYHNEGQTSEEEIKFLNYLILVTTTEELSVLLQDGLTALGYNMQQEMLGSIRAADTSTPFIFSNPSTADLAVGLNWQDGTLGLSVFKPDGSLYAQLEGSPPLIMEIPNAETGDWSIHVKVIDVPFDNYRFVVQIGVPAIVMATPSATLENPAATPAATTEVAQGSPVASLYLVIGGVLCLALLSVVVIIGVVFFLVKRRKARGK